ncbi:hypothetical protein ERJ75_001243200 [Trypanosoma vivax]|uniref:Uncharacterized protein n=1 Tax=Trypanosoma vivax (strain Y486) TaxID=1055687 RepID=G0TWI4_TRYVY|nr:hypothetical protein TRVL_03638 [Trypanosoma vivax]KAH8608809.1 hypothetical protein ERJ75_001243200 [Trypanosoma vivax]CCC48322.1 conserved hypothetical protein [Trypanosoma vivax Y486]
MLRHLSASGPFCLCPVRFFRSSSSLYDSGNNNKNVSNSNADGTTRNGVGGSATYFDAQDVDANRLNHHYWDDADSPYCDIILLQEEGMDEFGNVDIRDRELLSHEFLQKLKDRCSTRQ